MVQSKRFNRVCGNILLMKLGMHIYTLCQLGHSHGLFLSDMQASHHLAFYTQFQALLKPNPTLTTRAMSKSTPPAKMKTPENVQVPQKTSPPGVR